MNNTTVENLGISSTSNTKVTIGTPSYESKNYTSTFGASAPVTISLNNFINNQFMSYPSLDNYPLEKFDPVPDVNFIYFAAIVAGSTCYGKCECYGLSLSGGFTVPAGTDPDDENFTGAGISAGSCEDYYDQCTAASAAYGDPAGFECSVPYWTFTFDGQAFPPGIDNILGAGGGGSTYIEGQGCETIPSSIISIINTARGIASETDCSNYSINNNYYRILWENPIILDSLVSDSQELSLASIKLSNSYNENTTICMKAT